MNAKSLFSGAEYFLTFIDDFSHYMWVYILKKKDEVFKYFLEWKALVERFSGKMLNTLRTDNGVNMCPLNLKTILSQKGYVMSVQCRKHLSRMV